MANENLSESVKLPKETVNKARNYAKNNIPKSTIGGVIVAAVDEFINKNKFKKFFKQTKE